MRQEIGHLLTSTHDRSCLMARSGACGGSGGSAPPLGGPSTATAAGALKSAGGAKSGRPKNVSEWYS
jgi:hypothetical protein